ncbi:MAG: GNAT family N-acetyltransferase [archaeon]
MKITYKNTSRINPGQLFELYKSVGWIEKKDIKDKGKSLSKKHQNSTVVISAWSGKELVGAVLGLTDKIRNGAIFSLAVKKDFQSKGIGKELVRRCVREYPEVKWYIGSLNKRADKLYKRAGFRKDTNTWFVKRGAKI